MRIKPFAPGMEEFEVPRGRLLAVVKPRACENPPPLTKVLNKALERPIGSKRLEEEARDVKSVAILVDDHTRRTPVTETAPLVLERLFNSGLKAEQIRVFVALGTHRPMTKEEMLQRLGPFFEAGIEVLQHNPDGPSVFLGEGPHRSPLLLNPEVASCELILGIGHIAPHRVSGFTGGAKMLLPGVAARVSVDRTHWLSALFEGTEITGLRENPVMGEIDAVAQALRAKGKRVLKIDFVLDGKGKVVDAVFGEMREAHKNGVRRSLKWCELRLAHRSEIVVVDSFPTTLNMWQAAKGLYAIERAIKPGGMVVLLAPCPEGIAKEHPEVERFGYLPFEQVRRLVEIGEIKDLTAAAHIAHMGRICPSKARCLLVSEGIGPEGAKALGWEWAPSPQEAIDKALFEASPQATIAVVLSAGEVVVRVGSAD